MFDKLLGVTPMGEIGQCTRTILRTACEYRWNRCGNIFDPDGHLKHINVDSTTGEVCSSYDAGCCSGI